MKRILIGALLASGAMAGSAQATVYVGLQGSSGPITNETSSLTYPLSPDLDFASVTASYGNFSNTTVTATFGADAFPTTLISSVGTTVQAGKSGTLTVYVTETGLTGSVDQAFGTFSAYQTSIGKGLPNNWSVTESVYINTGADASTAFATENLVASTGAPPVLAGSFDSSFSPTSPWSITEVYTITVTSGKLIQGSAAISATAVPEPTTWAMLLVGFVGVGFAGFRRNRVRTLAA